MKVMLKAIAFAALITLPLVNASSAIAKEREIAVVIKIEGVPWFNVQNKGVLAAGKDLGVHAFQIGPSDVDPAQQVKIIEDLIARHVDAMVVMPNDANVLAPVLLKAQHAGIKVITNESKGQVGSDWNVETTDPTKFGKKVFEDLAKGMGGKGEYAVYVGTLTSPLHNKWADVGIAYLKKNYPDMKLVTGRFGVGEDVDASRTTTLDLLNTYPDLKGIAALGSLAPIGAAQALTQAGKTKDVYISGTFIPSQGARYLRTGAIGRGSLWDPAMTGYIMVEVANAELNNQPISKGFTLPKGGAAVVDPAAKDITFDTMIDLTAENADKYGF
jgi:simple sugar transport system substrate-binding protein